jgi:8-oxo-dGTP pyrophosphatase MutT (NUDIX family)
MRISARAIIVEDGKLLVFERTRKLSDGSTAHYLSVPGGALENNERPEEAVVRELMEELLIDIHPEKLVAHLRVRATQWFHTEEHYFYICTRLRGEPRFNPESDEATKSRQQTYTLVWRPLDELEHEPRLHPIYRQVMHELLPYLKADTTPDTPLDIDASNLV